MDQHDEVYMKRMLALRVRVSNKRTINRAFMISCEIIFKKNLEGSRKGNTSKTLTTLINYCCYNAAKNVPIKNILTLSKILCLWTSYLEEF